MRSVPYISPNLSSIICGCVENTAADAAKKLESTCSDRAVNLISRLYDIIASGMGDQLFFPLCFI